MNIYKITGAVSALALTAAASAATAADVWPFDVERVTDSGTETISYEGLAQASKPWQICVLFPHMKDSYWVGVNYGIIDQASKLGVKATILEAGGYTEAAKQVSQYNDCVARGVDAIIIGAISEAGLAKSMEEGKKAGIVQVGVINPLESDVVDAKIFANYDDAAEAGAKYLLDVSGGKPMNMLYFPGPQGSGWAEASATGVKRAVDGTSIHILEEKYGDTGKSVQLSLLEDALQANDQVDIVYGTAVTAEVARQALVDAGFPEAIVAAYYSNEGLIDLIKSGDVTATVTESPVMEARIAVDMAVRILEGEPHETYLHPSMTVVTGDNLAELDLTGTFAPTDWKPVYSVE